MYVGYCTYTCNARWRRLPRSEFNPELPPHRACSPMVRRTPISCSIKYIPIYNNNNDGQRERNGLYTYIYTFVYNIHQSYVMCIRIIFVEAPCY